MPAASSGGVAIGNWDPGVLSLAPNPTVNGLTALVLRARRGTEPAGAAAEAG
ncbi:hypothetical protein [Streptomyces sp. NPDC052811]|uniref:hypothetical protein n=1 Tax=Streptomyces sp. NPDC052811 TaxID=3155731 RepID=UPI00343EE24C